MQHRARDSLGRFLICFIMLDIETCRRTVFLTDCVHPGWIAIRFDVLRFHLRSERATAKRVVEHRIGCSQEIFLRKRSFLREKTPRPISHGELRIGERPRFRNRYHIKYCETLHLFRMIECEAIRNATATVVSDQIKDKCDPTRGWP